MYEIMLKLQCFKKSSLMMGFYYCFLWWVCRGLQDLRLALGLAESVSQSTPVAAATNELYKVAKSYGLSDQDFSAVIEALKAKQWEWEENGS